MIVYRVEHEQARFGPYLPPPFVLTAQQEAVRSATMRPLNGEADAHPSPYSDGLGEMSAGEYSCFSSHEALLTWFGAEALGFLCKIGFTVAAYEVAEAFVREGGRQAVFVRREGERVAVGVTASLASAAA